METLAVPHRLLSANWRFDAAPASGYSSGRATTNAAFCNWRGLNGVSGGGKAAKSGSLALVSIRRRRRAIACLSHSSPSTGICLILCRN